jgi:hypothetical protein
VLASGTPHPEPDSELSATRERKEAQRIRTDLSDDIHELPHAIRPPSRWLIEARRGLSQYAAIGGSCGGSHRSSAWVVVVMERFAPSAFSMPGGRHERKRVCVAVCGTREVLAEFVIGQDGFLKPRTPRIPKHAYVRHDPPNRDSYSVVTPKLRLGQRQCLGEPAKDGCRRSR